MDVVWADEGDEEVGELGWIEAVKRKGKVSGIRRIAE